MSRDSYFLLNFEIYMECLCLARRRSDWVWGQSALEGKGEIGWGQSGLGGDLRRLQGDRVGGGGWRDFPFWPNLQIHMSNAWTYTNGISSGNPLDIVRRHWSSLSNLEISGICAQREMVMAVIGSVPRSASGIQAAWECSSRSNLYWATSDVSKSPVIGKIGGEC